MSALEALRTELARIDALPNAEAAHCQAQLDQVNERIARCLKDRAACTSAKVWRILNESLHGLYVLRDEIAADMASCAS